MRLLHIRVVLAAFDCDEISRGALEGARELASTAGAKLHLVHVSPTAADAKVSEQQARTEASDKVHHFLDQAGMTPSGETLHILGGEPAHAIRSLADRVRADVIVLGRHRGGDAPGKALGSTALRVVTNSWAPCLVLGHTMKLPLERVLAPVDLSDASRGTLMVALSWASALRGAARSGGSTSGEAVKLTALHVARPGDSRDHHDSQRKMLSQALERLRSDAGTWAGVEIDGVVADVDDAVAGIAEYASEHDAQLVVLGTRGLGSEAVGRLGSVSLGVARKVTVPVLLVPPAVWSDVEGPR